MLPQLDIDLFVRLTCLVLLGAIVRITFISGTDFPLNDGGMFYSMVRDLQQAHYVLPEYITYNSASIPFAYPPLPFYIAGALSDLTGLSLIQVFQFLPLAMNVLTIIAFCLLASSMLKSQTLVIFSTLVFVFLPRSFQWLIMGGGLTRSTGMFFAILAIYQIYLMYTQRGRWPIVLAIAFSALSAVSHLETALFVACSAVILMVIYGRNRLGFICSLVVALGTIFLSSPWWVVILNRHGLTPFLTAVSSGTPITYGLIRMITDISIEPLYPILAALGLLGGLICFRDKKYFLPIWLVLLFIVDSRKALTTATVPLAMLSGIGIVEGLFPFLNHNQQNQSITYRVDQQSELLSGWPRQRLAQVVIIILIVYVAMAAVLGYRPLLSPLPIAERQAMQWIDSNTPASSAFVVITGEQWASDKTSEWFPVLANRVSVATVQGYEWKSEYRSRIENYQFVQKCSAQGVDCLNEWNADTGVEYTHVYLTKRATVTNGNTVHDGVDDEDPCWSLRNDLNRNPFYHIIYDNPGATVYVYQPAINYQHSFD